MQNSCSSSPQAIITPQFHSSLFEALDNISENTPVDITLNYLGKEDIKKKKLQGFDTKKYTSKGYLLQHYWLLSRQIKMARNIINRL